MGIAVGQQLEPEGFGEGREDVGRSLGEEIRYESDLLMVILDRTEGFLLLGEEGVDLLDQNLDLGNELDDSLGNQADSEVVAVIRPGGDDPDKLVDDIVEALILRPDLFADQAEVRLRLKSDLQRDMAC